MMRMLQRLALAATACTYAAGPVAQGEFKVPSPAVKASRQLVEQKEALVRRLLSDSPAARRIESSGNAEARKYLAGAQESYAQALRSIKSNDIGGADRQLNDATWSIGKARQLAPDPQARGVEQRVRYAQMLQSVESLRISYQRHLQRSKRHAPDVEVNDERLVTVARLVEYAKSLSNSERVAQANRALGNAEQTLMVGLSQILGTGTVEYTQRFETPAEEYAYELERNLSYADLIPIALSEFRPGSEAIREVQRFLDNNRQLRERAQELAAKKDHGAALKTLRRGTAYLQSALAAAGLRVPADSRRE
jgi:hypothetical protein